MDECPLKRDYFNRKYIFQPLIFRGGLLVFGGALCITKVASLYQNWAGWCVPCVFAPNPPAVPSKRTSGQKSHLHWSLYFGGFMFYKICNHWNLSKLAVLMLYFDWIWFWRHVFILIQAAFHFAIKTLRSKVNLIFSPPRTQGLSGKDQRFTPQFYDLSFFSPKKKKPKQKHGGTLKRWRHIFPVGASWIAGNAAKHCNLDHGSRVDDRLWDWLAFATGTEEKTGEIRFNCWVRNGDDILSR